jgi:uncharacterized membrane protein
MQKNKDGGEDNLKRRIYKDTAEELALVFFTGGVLYYTVEVLWRGWSHIAMAVLGGLCFICLYFMGRLFPRIPLLLYCILGGVIVSLLELGAGELLNNVLGLGIWDYSSLPLNFRGQVCLLFSFFWCLISLPSFFLSKLMRTMIFGCKE